MSKKGKNKQTKTTTASAVGVRQTGDWFKKDCHKGNTAIYQEENGGTLYIGGWNNGATFDWNTHVIDLTGTEHRYWDIPMAYDEASQDFLPFVGQPYAGWLSLPFPDYQIPKGISTINQWFGITQTIRQILQKGNDVLVACQGGHGRSGLFCAIVGYLLNSDTDRSWKSPVEKIRKIHCDEAVETYSQEKYIYDILGLDIKIEHVQNDNFDLGIGTRTAGSELAGQIQVSDPCPICGTTSYFVKEMGMCVTCKKRYEAIAPIRDDLTLEDIKHKGEVEHSCQRGHCVGIWKASKCGHVTHDMIVYEGWCQYCFDKHESEAAYAEKLIEEEKSGKSYEDGKCVICGDEGQYAEKFGVCYSCAEALTIEGLLDEVHNTITDPYKAYPHKCEADACCVGIVVADGCKHVVHNREIESGLCPSCLDFHSKRIQQEDT